MQSKPQTLPQTSQVAEKSGILRHLENSEVQHEAKQSPKAQPIPTTKTGCPQQAVCYINVQMTPECHGEHRHTPRSQAEPRGTTEPYHKNRLRSTSGCCIIFQKYLDAMNCVGTRQRHGAKRSSEAQPSPTAKNRLHSNPQKTIPKLQNHRRS